MKVFRTMMAISMIALILSSCKDEPVNDTPNEPNSEGDFKKKVLVEKLSSTNCGNCPLAGWQLEQMTGDYGSEFVYVSHYLFGPLHHEHTRFLLDEIDKTYFTPLAFINRNEEGEGTVLYQSFAWEDQVKNSISTDALLGLSLSTDFKDGVVSVKVNLAREDNVGNSNRLHIYITESVVVGETAEYHQRNYGNDDPEHPYYQEGDEIEGYKHRNILRAVLSNSKGDDVSWVDNESSAEYNAAFELDESKSMNEYRVIAFVTDGDLPSSGSVVNTQHVVLGESIGMNE